MDRQQRKYISAEAKDRGRSIWMSSCNFHDILTWLQFASKDELISTFSLYGDLIDPRTELLEDSCSACVAFAKICDAEKAFNSLDKKTAFGSTHASFRLHHLPESMSDPSVAQSVKKTPSSSPYVAQCFKKTPGRSVTIRLKILLWKISLKILLWKIREDLERLLTSYLSENMPNR